MAYRTIRKKLKRYRHRNQSYYPGFFRAIDVMVEGSKFLFFALIFVTIFQAV
ncbi:MAG: hypothetical protein AAF404_03300 [Pseudomonadota bacterium]